MGVLADLLANAITIAPSPVPGLDSPVRRQLEGVIAETGDFDRPAAYDAVDEVQSIAIHEAGTDGGTFTLTFTLKSGETFTTAAIDHDESAANIITAIDTAADGEVAGFTAGDIVATGGPLTTDPLVLTFSGASVAGQNHGLTVITSSLTASAVPSDAGEVTVTDSGQPIRYAWAAMFVMGLVTSAPPLHGVDITEATVPSVRGSFPYKLDGDTVKALINEAAFADNNESVRTVLMAAFGY